MSAEGAKECPFCAETIKAAAVVCRFCGRALSSPDAPRAAVPTVPPASSPEPLASAPPLRPSEIFDLLAGLVQKSLVVYGIDETDGGRYRLLETVRQYSRDRLVEAGSSDSARDRHLQFCLRLAQEAEPRLRGFGQKEWAARLESEHGNLRAALEWAMTADPEAGVDLCGALWWFWWMRGHVMEGRDWLERAFALPACSGSRAAVSARAMALCGAGCFAVEQGELAPGRAYLEESLALFRGIDEPAGCILALALLTNPAMVESAALARSFGEEGVALARRLDDPWHLGAALHMLGEVARYVGDLEQAAACCEETIAIYRQVGEEWLLGAVLHNLAWVRHRQGDPCQARALFEESLALFREQPSVMGMAYCLAGLAQSTADPSQPARAARLFAAAEGLLESIGQKMQPVDQTQFDRSVAAVRALMEEDAFSRAWTEGRGMSLQQAINDALEQEEAPP